MVFVVSFILGVKLNGYLLILTVMSVLFLWVHGKRQNLVLFVDTSVFRHSAFNRLLVISFINNAAVLAILFLFPLLSIQIFHLSAIGTGLILGGITIPAFLMSFAAKKALHSISGKTLIVFTIVLQLIGFLVLAFLGMDQLLFAILGVIIIYISFTMMTVVNNIEISQTLKTDKSAMGLGIYNLINFLGMSFGPSLSSRILKFSSNLSQPLAFFIGLLILSIVLSLISETPAHREIRRAK